MSQDGTNETYGTNERVLIKLSAHWRWGDSKQSNDKDYQSTQSNFAKDVPQQQMDGALLCKVNRGELARYSWLQQEKIPSTEADHREKENELRK